MLSLFGELPRIQDQVVLIILQIGNSAICVIFRFPVSVTYFLQGIFVSIFQWHTVSSVGVVLFTNLEKFFFPITEGIYRKVSSVGCIDKT